MTPTQPPDEQPPAVFRDRPILLLASTHWLAMSGLTLMVTAIVSWLVFLAAQMRAEAENPYVGIVLFVVIPLTVLVGVVLTVAGAFLGRRRALDRLRRGIADRRVAVRRLVGFGFVLVAINLTIGTQATLHAVHHMETRQFCASCHVMTPQTLAAEFAPHAALGCVKCHVGSGLGGWIESKVRGTKQLLEVMCDRVPRPIPGAVESGSMITADETCERCHWADKPTALRLKVIRRYAEDEHNTEVTTVLTMHVGGRTMGGIHGSHHGSGVRIRFAAADAKRQQIPWVEYVNAQTGATRTYFAMGKGPRDIEGLPVFEMQCIDCHNRVAHSFLPVDQAVDEALALGRVSVGLPYVKKQALAILGTEFPSREDAARQIPASLAEYYKAVHPAVFAGREPAILEAGRELADIWARNVFPEHAVTWGTYPDNRGHQQFPGCFRCHEGKHATADGTAIAKDCVVCHNTTALEETEPGILKQLGLTRPLQRMQRR
jgi:hypothetical protein